MVRKLTDPLGTNFNASLTMPFLTIILNGSHRTVNLNGMTRVSKWGEK